MRQAIVDRSGLARAGLVLALIVGVFGMHAWSGPAHAGTSRAVAGATPTGGMNHPAEAGAHAWSTPTTASSAISTGHSDQLLLKQPSTPLGHIGGLCLGLLTVSILIALLRRRARRAAPAGGQAGHPSLTQRRIEVDRQHPTLAELQVLRR